MPGWSSYENKNWARILERGGVLQEAQFCTSAFLLYIGGLRRGPTKSTNHLFGNVGGQSWTTHVFLTIMHQCGQGLIFTKRHCTKSNQQHRRRNSGQVHSLVPGPPRTNSNMHRGAKPGEEGACEPDPLLPLRAQPSRETLRTRPHAAEVAWGNGGWMPKKLKSGIHHGATCKARASLGEMRSLEPAEMKSGALSV